MSIDSSVKNFINYPDDYILKVEGTCIKAVEKGWGTWFKAHFIDRDSYRLDRVVATVEKILTDKRTEVSPGFKTALESKIRSYNKPESILMKVARVCLPFILPEKKGYSLTLVTPPPEIQPTIGDPAAVRKILVLNFSGNDGPWQFNQPQADESFFLTYSEDLNALNDFSLTEDQLHNYSGFVIILSGGMRPLTFFNEGDASQNDKYLGKLLESIKRKNKDAIILLSKYPSVAPIKLDDKQKSFLGNTPLVDFTLPVTSDPAIKEAIQGFCTQKK